ncbi:MAG: AMP-binding protein [Gemmatimonadota bacterium]|nr:AMP-binding protein [Gemmatimonadota bacterium]
MDCSTLPELVYPARMNCAVELLDATVVAGHGDNEVFVHKDTRWTYSELLERANRIAHVLVEDLGVVPGNRVLLRAPNTPMLAACWFAVLKAGGVVVATMPLLRPREIAYTARKARITLALTDSRVAADCERAMLSADYGIAGTGNRVVQFHTTEPDGLEAMMRDKPSSFASCDTASSDIALIAFTSGTTGRAKGTMHTHRDVMAITDCFARHVLRPDSTDVFCGSPPLAFTYALGGLLLFPMRFAASTLMLEQASPLNLVKAIQEHRPTICFTAPTAYRAMLGMLNEFDVSSLRKCVSAGETLPATTLEAWERATGVRIIDGIGATEMLHIFISASGDDIRPGSTGRAVPGYEARIVDENFEPVPPGVVGLLQVRGPTGCRYLDDPDRQRAYVRDGWNVTGDSYMMDPDGYFWYQARSDDMIVSSGYNIAAPEVENALLTHPAVRECAVVGLPDEERGHIVKAFVVLHEHVRDVRPSVKDLQDHAKREIAPYKYPRAIEFVDALPRTDTGKLQRFRLKEPT